jgi:hypothetical protein
VLHFFVYKEIHNPQTKEKERKKKKKKIDFEWRKNSPEAEISRGYVSSAAATPATVKFSVTPPFNWLMNWSHSSLCLQQSH